jgi:hypothetical protein
MASIKTKNGLLSVSSFESLAQVRPDLVKSIAGNLHVFDGRGWVRTSFLRLLASSHFEAVSFDMTTESVAIGDTGLFFDYI